MTSLAVAGGGDVGFENSDVFHPYSAVGDFAQARVRLVIEIFGEIFGRRIDRREGFNVIDHLMVEAFDGALHHLFEVLEIEQKACFVELGSGQSHLNFIIVAVRVLALAFVVAQVVPCRERIFYRHFVHSLRYSGRKFRRFYCTF